jgi:hypothetical protein
VRQALQGAADAAEKLTTRAFRLSFRIWLNQTGAPIATQQADASFQPCNDYIANAEPLAYEASPSAQLALAVSLLT